MKLPVWIKPALMGAVAGAIALAIFGFNWGGWMTTGGAEDMAEKQTAAAIVETLTPYCLENAKRDVSTFAQLSVMKDEPTRTQRALIEDAGWATPLGSDKADRQLADACLAALNAS